MSQSTSVVVRGWTTELSLRLSKASMALQFGDLRFHCQWVDATLLTASRGIDEPIPYHKKTMLEIFVELAEDPTTCGNFLDGKDMNPTPPMWSKPLLDSTITWEHTMHLRFTQQAGLKKKVPALLCEEAPPSLIHSATWSSQGWRLVTHPRYLTLPHHDCCGMGAYVVGNTRAKIWAIMRPK